MKKESSIIMTLRAKLFIGILCLGMIIVSFNGCGSSESTLLYTGVFLDTVVEGLEFQSGSRSGITDNSGKFYFKENETVTFSLGGLIIGEPSSAQALMTPIDLVDAPDSFVTHPTVTNICRLLQSLDVDGDLTNGILISKDIRNEIESLVGQGLQIDFSLSVEDFGNQAGIQILFDRLNVLGVFTDGGVRTLTSGNQANAHFFNTLSENKMTPVVMINLGDGLTNGTQSGFGNVHQYTQVVGYAAYISYKAAAACDLVWVNPLLELLDEERTFTRILLDDETETPYNLGVDGATIQSLLEEKTGDGNELLDELMKPVPEDGQMEVTQLEAALYVADVAGRHPEKLKLFTLWIGAEDSLGAVTADRSGNLVFNDINAFLNDQSEGHDLDSVDENLTAIVDQLLAVPYSYIFMATIPHVETIGAFFNKEDIEILATFDDVQITDDLGDNELVGYNPFVDKDGVMGTSIAGALDSDNETLNAAIEQTISTDAYVLNEAEINLLNDRIDDINEIIATLAEENDTVFLVDLADLYDDLIGDGIALETKTLTKTFGKGFYSLDGYYPSHTGYVSIAAEFMGIINDQGIGIEMPPYNIDEAVLVIDPYNADSDEDDFVLSPGMIPTLLTVPIYDPFVGGWIDCDGNDNTIFPEFVSGEPCF